MNDGVKVISRFIIYIIDTLYNMQLYNIQRCERRKNFHEFVKTIQRELDICELIFKGNDQRLFMCLLCFHS